MCPLTSCRRKGYLIPLFGLSVSTSQTTGLTHEELGAADLWNDDQLFWIDGPLQGHLITGKETDALRLFPQQPCQKRPGQQREVVQRGETDLVTGCNGAAHLTIAPGEN